MSELTAGLNAELNHGRWIVRCPACPSAEMATDTFVCNARRGGCGLGPLPVIWPENRDEIERAVARRPAANQNWQPSETVEFLIAENVVHGVS